MDNERLEKYRRKFSYIIQKLDNLPPSENENKYYWDIIFYRFHTSIQVLMDIIAMLCKDFGIDVQDDYSNIEHLSEKSILDLEELKLLLT